MIDSEQEISDADRGFVAPSTSEVVVSEQDASGARLEQLANIRQGLEDVTDRLGHPIEPGIIDTVTVMNALKLPTNQSCEGHLDRAASAPWVEIYPPEPDVENWYEDEELRAPVIAESERIEATLQKYLEEFYADRQTDDRAKLVLDPIAYGFRIQPAGLEWAEAEEVSRDPVELEHYRQEMRDFTAFLTNKFLFQAS